MQSRKSYSQCVRGHRADIDLLQHFLNVPDVSGVFLEMGACDGVLYSNTKLLEEKLNYTGILIEPGIGFYKKLIKNRPKCKNYNLAISNKEGEVSFIGKETAVGGVVNSLSNNWIRDWKLNTNEIYNIKTTKLSSVLKDSEVKYIDLWSLDVEGSELEVLEGMDWDIPVYIIIIEVAHDVYKDKTEKCREILRKQGFTCDGIRRGLDEFWINNNYFRKDLLFKKFNN